MKTPCKYELAREAMKEMSIEEIAMIIAESIGTKEDCIEYIFDHFQDTVEDIADDAFYERDAYVTDHTPSAPWRSAGW